ncbi:LacI family DNA-binding transcriptional regulator [uncultured Ilyobacter sp.]|uniref:LacI family DNA-binding transcriptional regulator n=1 Tax=uncultured Ilyobacter sp. TaxID=544433 RepID=UPI002AA85C86|nr:LacI family DNA-binding transcriptional regulator [uncultured Ilyobacter sp.]
MKRVKMSDVARKAGVSLSTVSQYMNCRYEYMSGETKDKIKSVMAELNYVPNSIARSLATAKTKTIGVIVGNITGYFTSSVVRGVEDYCKKNGFSIIIYNTDHDIELEQNSINILKMLRVDGILIVPSGKNNQLINKESISGMPIVQMYMEYDDLNISTVISNYRESAYDATEYFINLGHKNIAVITQEYENTRSRFNRILGYKDALINNGLSFREDSIHIWDLSSDMNVLFEKIVKSKNFPTAIFVMHSAITINLLKYFKLKNINIPEDFSIIGFDEIPNADLMKTPITVVKQPTYEIGEKSAKLLLEKINSTDEVKNKKIIIPCQLKIRESCKKHNKTKS